MGNILFQALLPIHRLTLVMRFHQASTPGFFHQAALTAWLRFLLHSPQDYDLYLTIDTPEQGRRHFKAGDDYRFTIIALGEIGKKWLDEIKQQLQGDMNYMRWDKRMPFRDNWSLHDGLPCSKNQSLQTNQTHIVMDIHDLQEQANRLRQQQHISIRMISPWRILREKSTSPSKLRGEMRFCRDNEHLQTVQGPLWLMRISDTLADLLRRRGMVVPAREAMADVEAKLDVFWVDSSYKDKHGTCKPMGGLLGCVEHIKPAQLSEQQILALLLGQYIGIGQRRAFGLGRYQILDENNQPLFTRIASQSLLERAMADDNLCQAEQHVCDDALEQAWDDEDIKREFEPRNEKLADLAQVIKRGQYVPPPLHGFVHEDADGGLRPLASPPIYDRIMQRAVHQQLAPMLDGIMHEGSYGFRAGRSRYQVRDMIQRLYREGYRWVFESDIRSFFDTVTWKGLENRLNSLLGDDPIIPLILTWIKQPVRWKGHTIERSKGLPQGSPLSPVLANMMLDDFDHDLTDAGCKLIRFADDFVIIAKSQEDAKRGGELASQALLDAGLEMHKDKTHITPFSEGFRFLGFMFVDGIAVEAAPKRSDDAGKAPPQSWLAQAMDKESLKSSEHVLRGKSAVPLAAYHDATRVLIFCGEPAILFSRAGALCIEREDIFLHRIPWSQLDAVVMFGRHQMTTPALHVAMKHHVPIHMASSSGTYMGVASSGKAGFEQSMAWLKQSQCFEQEAWALAAAKSIIDARIRHMMESLRRRTHIREQAWKDAMEKSLRQVQKADDRQMLNGVEGNASKVYFAALKEIIPAEFHFQGRNRRPPQDPFNALLSLGFTYLYAVVDSLLRVDGLLPVIGFYHQSHGSHAALASDLMEPFRHIVEREAINMLQNKRLKVNDFTINEQGCRLSAAARRLYMGALTKVFLHPLNARGGKEALTIFEHIHRQNLALKFVIAGANKQFQAWRMR